MQMADKPNVPVSPRNFAAKHPVLLNLGIIIIVAVVGIMIVYFSFALFTKHGQSDVVPSVENMSYTEAVSILYEKGFKVDIRDSLYKDDVKPGYVIEQYPKGKSVVKPGRKIFLYINAVHPREVVIDDDNHPMENALKGFSLRSGMARLEELGFKNVRVVTVLGDNDCIVKVLANGRTVKKMQKVPVNAKVVVEVYDNRLQSLRDSLSNEEMLQQRINEIYNGDAAGDYGSDSPDDAGSVNSGQSDNSERSSGDRGTQTSDGEEDVQFF